MDDLARVLPEDYQALAEFRHRLRVFLHASEEAARAHGIEPQQHQLLLAAKGVAPGQEATIGLLAELLQIRHHSVVELVDRLVDHGLIERRRDENDRRRVLVVLTDAGERLLERLSRFHLDELVLAGPALVRALQAVLARAGIPALADEHHVDNIL